MLTLDTSALYAILQRDDPNHKAMISARNDDPGPHYIPAGILAEVAYMIESNLSLRALQGLIADLASGAYTLDCGEEDLPYISELAGRYANLPLGFADAAVIACAERHRGRVLTSDRRDFLVVAREGRIRVLPEVL